MTTTYDYGPKLDQQATGYAWATFYEGDGPDDEHTSVWWRPATSPQHEPPFKVVQWTRRRGVIRESGWHTQSNEEGQP